MKTVLFGSVAAAAIVLGLSGAQAQAPNAPSQKAEPGVSGASRPESSTPPSGAKPDAEKSGERSTGGARDKTDAAPKSNGGTDTKPKEERSPDRTKSDAGPSKAPDAKAKGSEADESRPSDSKARETGSGNTKAGAGKVEENKPAETKPKAAETRPGEKNAPNRVDEKGGSQTGSKEPSDTGKGAPGTNGASNPGTGERGRDKSDGNAGNRETPRDGRNTDRDERSTPGSNAGSRSETGRERETEGNVQLNREQETRVNRAFSDVDVRSSTSVDISVSVGAAVPDRVSLRPLPPSVIEIVPQYRGYEYVVVRDEIVIVQPRTKKVVYVVHRSSGQGQGRSSKHRPLNITGERLSTVQRTVTRSAPKVTREVRVEENAVIPRDIELRRFPETVITEIPDLRTYEYFVERNDAIVIVDPDTREVVEVLR